MVASEPPTANTANRVRLSGAVAAAAGEAAAELRTIVAIFGPLMEPRGALGGTHSDTGGGCGGVLGWLASEVVTWFQYRLPWVLRPAQSRAGGSGGARVGLVLTVDHLSGRLMRPAPAATAVAAAESTAGDIAGATTAEGAAKGAACVATAPPPGVAAAAAQAATQARQLDLILHALVTLVAAAGAPAATAEATPPPAAGAAAGAAAADSSGLAAWAADPFCLPRALHAGAPPLVSFLDEVGPSLPRPLSPLSSLPLKKGTACLRDGRAQECSFV